MFYLDLSNETCLFAQQEDVWLWHKRLCHVNFDNVVNISKMKKVRGFQKLKKSDNAMCKQCQLGKMTKSSFKRKTYISSDSFDDELDELEALIAKIFGRGRGKYKGKLPIIYFACNKVGHIVARCPVREDKDERNESKYKGSRDD